MEISSGIEMRPTKDSSLHRDAHATTSQLKSEVCHRSRPPSTSVMSDGVAAIALSATSAFGAVSSPIAATSGATSPITTLSAPSPSPQPYDANRLHLDTRETGKSNTPNGTRGGQVQPSFQHKPPNAPAPSSRRRLPGLFTWRRNTRSYKPNTDKTPASAPALDVPSFVLGIEDTSPESSAKHSPRSDADNYPLTSDPSHHLHQRHSASVHRSHRNEDDGAGEKSLPKGIPLPTSLPFNRKRQIKFRRKLYEFFVAPITTFWAWSISFLIFLCALTYVLLIRTPPKPTYVEWYLLAYVVTFGLETLRKFFMSEPKKFGEKAAYFFGNYWNLITAIAIIGFIVGFVFRVNPPTSSVGRVILAVDSVLWSIKLLDFLGVHPRFGPYITMAGKMVMSMSSIVVMLVISLLAFGLARQSITYPDEEWHWLLLRNVFYKPYFMLYGEVYADEIDTCGDEAWDEHLDKRIPISHAANESDSASCVPGHWIPPLLMTAFLLIANILLISMLIAIFNNIYEASSKIAQQIWLFQRYRQVIEYEGTPFLPPPFTTFYHMYMMIKYLRYRNRCCFSKKFPMCGCLKRFSSKHHAFKNQKNRDKLTLFDFTLKLFLSEDQVEKLHDFEEECMEDMAREKEFERNRSNEERLHRTAERTDLILVRLTDLASKENTLKGNVRELETRLETMEARQEEMLDCMRQISTALPTILQSIHASSQAHPCYQHQLSQPISQPMPQHSHTLPTTSMPHLQQQQSAAQSVRTGSVDNGLDENLGTVPPTNQQQRPSPAEVIAEPLSDLAVAQRIPSRQISLAEGLAGRQPILGGGLFPDASRLRAGSHSTVIGSGGTTPVTSMHQPQSPEVLRGTVDPPFAMAQRRTRTTTINGPEIPCTPITTNMTQSQIFDSLISLDPNLIGGSTSQITPHHITRRSSIRRRRRHHDEYTSITDAIDIEEVQRATLASATQNVGNDSNDSVDEEDDNHSRQLSVSSDKLKRRTVAAFPTQQLAQQGTSNFDDTLRADINTGGVEEELGDDVEFKIGVSMGHEDVTEFGDSHRLERDDDQNSSQASTIHRVDTPNTSLRRARASFIRRQNSLLKSFEEDVGGPSSSIIHGSLFNEPRRHIDGSNKHEIVKVADEEEKASNASKEDYITFSAPLSREKSDRDAPERSIPPKTRSQSLLKSQKSADELGQNQ
ncbi:ion transport protein domain-containing protein [Ditylenchus destructor]|uniref:Ion transport protein domain-containing protein n=1 Tax=Ditylenchus destructor TaxID=166010 RepID=A0AAD4NG48_9BILA|nr:ion transport protein domain-containing protein [Ditylenchus destructor]